VSISKQLQSGQRDLSRDDRRFIDLREVAHAAQQPVGDSRRPARPRGQLVRTSFVDRHVQQRRGAPHDLAEFIVIVEVEMEMLAEPVRSGELSNPDRVVAPTSVNGLTDSFIVRAPIPSPPQCGTRNPPSQSKAAPRLPLQAMNLVDEQHVVLFEIVHDCGEVGSALDRRSQVTWTLTPSSRAMICASEVLPRPGGPANST